MQHVDVIANIYILEMENLYKSCATVNLYVRLNKAQSQVLFNPTTSLVCFTEAA